MIYPAADKLDALGSKYELVIVAAKRARQLKEQARHLVDTRSTNTLTIALEEIGEGQIIPLLVGEPERLPESLPATPVLGGLVSTSSDEDDMGHEPTTAAEIGALLSGSDDDDYEADDDMGGDVIGNALAGSGDPFGVAVSDHDSDSNGLDHDGEDNLIDELESDEE